MKWLDGWKKIFRSLSSAPYVRITEKTIMESNYPPRLYPAYPHWSIRSQGCYLHTFPNSGGCVYVRHWDTTKRSTFNEYLYANKMADLYLSHNHSVPSVRIYHIVDGKESRYKEIKNPNYQPDTPQSEIKTKPTFAIRLYNNQGSYIFYDGTKTTMYAGVPPMGGRYHSLDRAMNFATQYVKFIPGTAVEVVELNDDRIQGTAGTCSNGNLFDQSKDSEQPQPKKKPKTCFAIKLSGSDGRYIYYDCGKVVLHNTVPPMWGQYWELRGAISTAHGYVGEYKVPVEVVEVDGDKVVSTPWKSDTNYISPQAFDSEQHTTKTCYAILRKDTGHYLTGIAPQIEWKKGLENAQLYRNKPTAETQAQYANKEIEIIPVEYESIERRTIVTA